jgi:hypothetical protein
MEWAAPSPPPHGNFAVAPKHTADRTSTASPAPPGISCPSTRPRSWTYRTQ